MKFYDLLIKYVVSFRYFPVMFDELADFVKCLPALIQNDNI